jgi:hypothetical protein
VPDTVFSLGSVLNVQAAFAKLENAGVILSDSESHNFGKWNPCATRGTQQGEEFVGLYRPAIYVTVCHSFHVCGPEILCSPERLRPSFQVITPLGGVSVITSPIPPRGFGGSWPLAVEVCCDSTVPDSPC